MPHTPPTHTHTLFDERGQTLSEYGLLVALIAIVVALVLPAVTAPIQNIFRAAAAAFGG